MIIGNFTYDTDKDVYTGALMTLTVHREEVRICANEKKADREPDYRVVAQTAWGTFEFGAAWKRTSERGQDFLSVSLDDPSLGGPLNAALFLDEDDDSAALVWTRPKAKAVVEAKAEGKKPKAKAKAA
jgi:uncharacterized protein (DUF736 family)